MRITSMSVAAVVVLFAALLTTARAADEGDQPLSTFLARCTGDDSSCVSWLESGFDTGVEMGEICAPPSVSTESGARTVLTWLRNAAAYNQALAEGSESDAEWTALHTLWPC